MQASRESSEIFKCWEKNESKLKILHAVKLSLKTGEYFYISKTEENISLETKMFSRKKKVNKFVATRFLLQEMIKEILNRK